MKEMDAVQMLGLKLPTDPRWVNIAEKSIDEILIDHAYCEQKAATSCISMIVLYHHHEDIVDGLSPIVSEEWAHFRAVLAEMRKRGIKMKTPRKDEYVNQLLAFVKKIETRPSVLRAALAEGLGPTPFSAPQLPNPPEGSAV